MPNIDIKGFDPTFMAAVWLIIAAAVLLVHLTFAAGVAAFCRRLAAAGRPICLAPPFIWMLATLLGGVFVAGVFWFIHVYAPVDRDPSLR